MKRACVLWLLVFVLCSTAAPALSATEYRIGVDDVVKVTVYNHPELTAVERVNSEGAVMLPLIGEVRIAGLSVEQASKKISSLLADGYIVDPNVSVFVSEFRSQKIMIMGQVARPGVFTLSGNTTFLELLTLAGGLTREAGDKAIIKRKHGTDPVIQDQIITIDLKKLIELGESSLDIELMDNDNIYVSKAALFYITGEVKKPDAYKHEEGITVIKAATMAGGFTDKAAPGRTRIIRKIEKKERVIERAGMDEPVLPDDIIIVPESFF